MYDIYTGHFPLAGDVMKKFATVEAKNRDKFNTNKVATVF